MSHDKAGHKVKYKIKKFNSEKALESRETDDPEPDEVSEFEKNVFLNEGIGAIWDLTTGLAAPTEYNNANATIGVGNGTTSEDSAQGGLQGGSTSYQGMDTGYPSRSSTTVTFYSTFGGTEAKFAWEEFTVSNANDNTGENINRKVSAQGTKAAGTTWEIEIQLTIA